MAIPLEDPADLTFDLRAIDLLRTLERADISDLDLYIVSPFRIVAQKLRDLLVTQRALTRWTDEPQDWVKERVGTVYTVQGREADTVVMILLPRTPKNVMI